MKIFKSDFLLFGIFLIIGGLISIYLKYEILWDFANYHYYNAWALLNGRLWTDVGLGAYHAFINPLVDVPLYLLIENFNDYPDLIYFFQGMYFGALEFVLFLFARQFWGVRDWKSRLAVILVLLIGGTGFATASQIGTSSNEIQTALLVLTGFYLLQKELFFKPKMQNWRLLLSGFVMGMAMGLKLTAIIYCVAAGLSLILFSRRLPSPVKNIFVFTLGGLLGFLLCNGYWMYLLWEHFDNPFFPFANTWFKSDWLPVVNFRDTRFIPQDWLEGLFYPIVWSLGKYHYYDVLAVTDIRPLLLFIILIGYVLCLLVKWKKDGKFLFSFSPLNFMVLFLGIAYCVWLSFFGIVRYYIVLEVLGAIFIVKLIFSMWPSNKKIQIFYLSLINIVVFALCSTMFFSNSWGQRRDTNESFIFETTGLQHSQLNKGASYEKYLLIEDLKLPDNTLVLFGALPNSFVLPYLNNKSKVYGISYLQDDYTLMGGKELWGALNNDKWQHEKQKLIEKYGDPKVFIITLADGNGGIKNALPERYIKGIQCRLLKNNVMSSLWVCAEPDNFEKYLRKEIEK